MTNKTEKNKERKVFMGLFDKKPSDFRFTVMGRKLIVKTEEKTPNILSELVLYELVNGVEQRLYGQYRNCVDIDFRYKVDIQPSDPDFEYRRAQWFVNYALKCVEKGELGGHDACLAQRKF